MPEDPQTEAQIEDVIEYRCPVCKTVTIIVIGVSCCKGCGRSLRLIQVDADRFRDFGDN